MDEKLSFLLVIVSIAVIYLPRKKQAENSKISEDSVLFSKIKYRLVGPFRRGRSAAVAGNYNKKNTFYFGATGGGVWKTMDGGSDIPALNEPIRQKSLQVIGVK